MVTIDFFYELPSPFALFKMCRTEIRHKGATSNGRVPCSPRKVPVTNNHPIICKEKQIHCSATRISPITDWSIERKWIGHNLFSLQLLNVMLLCFIVFNCMFNIFGLSCWILDKFWRLFFLKQFSAFFCRPIDRFMKNKSTE